MSMTDPIADMLTRVRNAQQAGHKTVSMPSSKLKAEIAKLLKDEGYIQNFSVSSDEKPELTLDLKYFENAPVISSVKRVSRPGRRVYCAYKDLPRVLGGLGVAIVSTPQGLMSDRAARKAHLGGEVLAEVA